MNIANLDPQEVWGYFYELTQIPRPSKKEQKAAEFIRDFGRKLGLETIVDGIGNVLIRKPATPGMADRKGVILQSHIDTNRSTVLLRFGPSCIRRSTTILEL